MTQTETLLALIKRATDNGFNNHVYLHAIRNFMMDGEHPPVAVLGMLLMHREFVKAVWGDTTGYHAAELARGDLNRARDTVAIDGFKYYVQQVAAADDPFAYLVETF